MFLADLAKQARNPVQLALLLLLSVGIVFETKIPAAYSEFADGALGRVLIVAVFLALEASYHWTLGILWIVFALLLVSPSKERIEGFLDAAKPTPAPTPAPKKKMKEGFDDVALVERPERWFVERVLKENPAIIKEREVNTYPVQD